MAKVDMKSTDYYKSGKHKENILAANEKAAISSQQKKQERITNYNLDPKICLNTDCNNPISYEKKLTNKFCSHSCAASINNVNRSSRTAESKDKTSKSMKDKKKLKRKSAKSRKHSPVLLYCKVCESLFVAPFVMRHRKTCGSRRCTTIASTGNRTYQNGSRKPEYYFNKWQNKDILLDSSWEIRIAKLLDSLNIAWSRPQPIEWFDIDALSHLYYPDFYLPLYNLYLDPKNTYCMLQDEYKMARIQEKINIIFGDIILVEEHIKMLPSLS